MQTPLKTWPIWNSHYLYKDSDSLNTWNHRSAFQSMAFKDDLIMTPILGLISALGAVLPLAGGKNEVLRSSSLFFLHWHPHNKSKCISFRGDRTGSGFVRRRPQAASFQSGSFKIASKLRILNSQEAVSAVAWSVINLIPLEDRPGPLPVPNLRPARGEKNDLKIKAKGKVWVVHSEPISMAAGGSIYS